jgi:hypothetical protein
MVERGTLVLFVLSLIYLWEQPAAAYLDPASAGMLLQVLLGGGAAVAVAFRLLWLRVKRVLRKENP